jgi:nitrogen fixation protein FixH
MRAAIVIALLIGVSITAVTIVVGTRTFEGTVVKDAYTEGLKWDELRRARLESGWSARLIQDRLPVGRSTVQVRLLDHAKRPFQEAKVYLAFTRPETSRYDRSYEAKTMGKGIYTADIDLPRAGGWQVRISVFQGGQTVLFNDALVTGP